MSPATSEVPDDRASRLSRIEEVIQRFFTYRLTPADRKRFMENGTFCPVVQKVIAVKEKSR
jgi:hypothetical protein